MSLRLVIGAADALKNMTERPMADVVKQSGTEADGFGFIVDCKLSAKLGDDFSRRLHHSKAVAVAGMIGPGISKTGHAKLSDSPQALKLGRIEQPKKQGIDRALQLERDHIMHRVSDDLFRHESTI